MTANTQIEDFIFTGWIFNRMEAFLRDKENEPRDNPVFKKLLREFLTMDPNELDSWWGANKVLFTRSLTERGDAYQNVPSVEIPPQALLPYLATVVEGSLRQSDPHIFALQRDWGFSLDGLGSISRIAIEEQGDRIFHSYQVLLRDKYQGRQAEEAESILIPIEGRFVQGLGVTREQLFDYGYSEKRVDSLFQSFGGSENLHQGPRPEIK